ncbi:MAG: lysozyme inhibitor LprI family protein [Thiomonas sp.]|uniref:lysozyme inhibitor LprI family protein n=1 Tax=Thiomonas sp. TaxID=2047785 RepID=UPI002A35FDDC|nr:lysozyme inhibitor LprI family protein [Thiomonas sp.]MDY0330963.1 lysozyme inhibitor LprI family protein [Thiomonas sp.]
MLGRGILCGGLLALACIGQAQAAPEVKTPPICLSQPHSADCAAQTRHALNDRMFHLYRLELQKVMGTYTERRLVHAQNLWRRWANAECLFRDGPPDHGGAEWNQRQDACLSGMIRTRIAQLDGFLHCSGATCPPR